MEQKDEHIVINRECGSEKEIVCLVDDEDLASVIWTQGFNTTAIFVVDISQSRHYFGLITDSYIDLLRFDGELADTKRYWSTF
ncbi:uncharacterized protein OCT59_016618 [Rhizophagus irregularis]|uniref:uncharacterized protein n=1 Tax=Rhizophagus irregularis TaxID=588596 RepID=UPI003332BFFB|nr:hypothetical protein OCT59_016618 [Rhizophagus irregularis]